MLRVDIYQPAGKFTQHARTHRQVTDISATLARGRNNTPNCDNRLVIKVLCFEKTFQTIASQLEHSLHDTCSRRVFLHSRFAASAQQQPQGSQKYGLAGSCLAGHNVESGPESHLKAIYQSVVFNR